MHIICCAVPCEVVFPCDWQTSWREPAVKIRTGHCVIYRRGHGCLVNMLPRCKAHLSLSAWYWEEGGSAVKHIAFTNNFSWKSSAPVNAKGSSSPWFPIQTQLKRWSYQSKLSAVWEQKLHHSPADVDIVPRFLWVMGPQEVRVQRAVPSQALWAKVQPPDALPGAPSTVPVTLSQAG